MSEVGSEEGGGRSASPSESSGDPPPAAPGAESTTGADSEAGADAATRTDAETGPETGAETAETGAETDTETKSEPASEAKAKDRVNLLLKAAGDAPIMRQRLWKVDPSQKVTWVVQFIKRYIRMEPEESLFVYVSQAFSPAPDQTIGNLLECFGSEGKLVMHYCKTQAWG